MVLFSLHLKKWLKCRRSEQNYSQKFNRLKMKRALANLIQTMAESEALIEEARILLSQQILFEPQSAFLRVDQARKGMIDANLIAEFLNDNSVIINVDEASELIKQYDSNKKGYLSKADFFNLIMVSDLQQQQQLFKRQPYTLRINTLLPQDVEWSLSRLIAQAVQNIRNIFQAQATLLKYQEFNLVDSIPQIDIDGLGFITLHNLIDFVKQNTLSGSSREIEYLYQILDDKRQGQVTYEKLQSYLLPLAALQKTGFSQTTTDRQQRQGSEYFANSYSNPGSFVAKKNQAVVSDHQSADESHMRNQAFLKSQMKVKQLKKGREQMDSKIHSTLKLPKENSSTTTKQSRMYQTPKRKNYEDLSEGYRTTPLKGNEEHHLVQALHELIVINNELENTKSQLALRQDFHPAKAFKMLDKNQRDQINKLDFELAVNDLSVYPSSDQVYLLFQHYSPESTFMNYKSFLGLVLPCSEQYQEIMLSRETNDKMGNQTQKIFVNLLNQHFSVESQAEHLRQKLRKRPLFNVPQAFYAVDKEDKGYLTLDQFSKLFEEYNIVVQRKDLESLIRMFDTNFDGKVSFSEFLYQMSPKRVI